MKKLLLILLISTATFAVVNVKNFSFEEPAVTDRVWLEGVTNYWDYYGGPFLSNGVGVINEYNSPFCPSLAAADGSQFAFLWCGAGAEIAQTMSGYVSNHTYSVSWAASARGATTGGVLWVLMDAETLARYPLFEEKFIITNIEFTATASNHRLRFFHVGEWDKMIFVDDIHIQETGLPPNPPANLTASQGIYSNKVEITWETYIGDNIVSSEIYRAEINSTNTAIIISGLPNTNQFADFSAIVNSNYFYWVRTMNINGWSDYSESVYGFSTDSEGPDTPGNVSPVDGAYIPVSSLPTSLDATAYSDPDGWPMVSVQWQMNDNTIFSSPTWDTGEIFTNATNITAPSGPLVMTNYWRVRYKNNRNKWSDWSAETFFITEKDFNSPFYFYETFNNISTSGDVNKEYYISGRQLGSAVPIDYVSHGTTIVGIEAANTNKLTLSGAGASCSPNQSFEKYSNFKIEFEIEPGNEGTAICFGKLTKNAAPNSQGGMGIVFYGNGSGRYDVYNNDSLIAVITNPAATGVMHVLVSVSTLDFEYESANVALFVNGQPLPLEKYWLNNTNDVPEQWYEIGWRYRYIYNKGNGFGKNFVSFYNLGGNGIIDNLKIEQAETNAIFYSWSDDSNSKINSENNYSHNVNLCSDNDVTVNSVLFSGTGKTSSIFIANGNPTLVGTNWAAIDSDGAFEQDYPWTVDDVSPPSGVANTGKQLLEDVLFDKYGDYYLELDVTPGTSNVFTFYRHAWADDETFQTVANDGGAPKEFTYGAAGTGGIIEYKYLAPENGKFKIVVSPAKTISAFSNYEITNSIIPILESINELNFGEIVQGESKTLLLPIFNLGGETVSGVFSNSSAPFSFPDGSNYFAMPESPDFVNITFAPFTDGNFSNTITLSGCGGSAQVELKGTAIPEPFLFINCYLLFIIYYLRKRM